MPRANLCANGRCSAFARKSLSHVGVQAGWSGGELAAIGSDEDQLAIGVALDAPTAFVDQPMVY